jgi:hypothetical protein
MREASAFDARTELLTWGLKVVLTATVEFWMASLAFENNPETRPGVFSLEGCSESTECGFSLAAGEGAGKAAFSLSPLLDGASFFLSDPPPPAMPHSAPNAPTPPARLLGVPLLLPPLPLPPGASCCGCSPPF